jgi:hypothetical protein
MTNEEAYAIDEANYLRENFTEFVQSQIKELCKTDKTTGIALGIKLLKTDTLS